MAKEKTSVSLREQTGADYAEWFQRMDDWGARGRAYRDIAVWLTGQGLSEWWAQKLVVEYEQERGVRRPGARRDGTFSGGASRTIAAAPERVFAAFADPKTRARWMPELELRERTAKPPRSARFDVSDGTRLAVTVLDGAGGRTQVAVEHERLPDSGRATVAKAEWRDRLSSLKAMLEA